MIGNIFFLKKYPTKKRVLAVIMVIIGLIGMSLADYKGKNIIIRRLRRQQLLGAMLLVLTGVIMLLWKRNEWIVCLTVAAVLELYTAFRIPQEEAKEN